MNGKGKIWNLTENKNLGLSSSKLKNKNPNVFVKGWICTDFFIDFPRLRCGL